MYTGCGKVIEAKHTTGVVLDLRVADCRSTCNLINGFYCMDECHHMYHGEKVASGNDYAAGKLENIPAEELEDIIDWCIELGPPVTLKELGITEGTDEKLMAVATAACAENDTLP